MCDFQWISENKTVIPGHGAMHQDGSRIGAFSRDLDNDPANGESWSCTRLVYKHVEGGA